LCCSGGAGGKTSLGGETNRYLDFSQVTSVDSWLLVESGGSVA